MLGQREQRSTSRIKKKRGGVVLVTDRESSCPGEHLCLHILAPSGAFTIELGLVVGAGQRSGKLSRRRSAGDCRAVQKTGCYPCQMNEEEDLTTLQDEKLER